MRLLRVLSPSPLTPVNSPSGYGWRDQRGANDWRNNDWRDDRIDQDWRNRNWQTRRGLDDWRERQYYSKTLEPNNAFGRGYIECGNGAAGLSFPCSNYAKDGSPKQLETTYDSEKTNAREKQRGVENCGHGDVWRRC